VRIIWATRGRAWGFRFLLDGGHDDPLPVYDRAFAGTENESTVYRRVGPLLALRFPDPKGRQDQAGRVIPHDVVVEGPPADDVRSLEDALRLVWPLLADIFANDWERPRPLARRDVTVRAHR